MTQAYLPHSAAPALLVAGLIGVLLLAGHALGQARPARAVVGAAWLLAVAAVIAVAWPCRAQPDGFRMAAIIVVALVGMKVVVLASARAAGMPPLRAAPWLGFALGWPGMQPRIFLRRSHRPLAGGAGLLRGGALRLALGVALVFLARLVWVWTGSSLLATAPALIGLSLALHFGVFDLLTGIWRLAGVDVGPPFRAPLRSTSLREFWGRRWNLAFSEMTSIAVYRPLSARVGRGPATAAAFLFSGLLHEMAISLPVGAGFGLPMLYFVLHGALMLVERAARHRGQPVAGAGGRAWTLAWLVLPLPLLFHPWFLAGVIWPLVGIG